MKTLLREADRRRIIERLHGLRPIMQPRWGRMTASQREISFKQHLKGRTHMRELRYSTGLLLAVVWIAPLRAQETTGSTSEVTGSEVTHQPVRSDRVQGGREKVTGIGGLFFRSRDPKALSRWYLTHLGINLTPTSYEELPWRQEAGPTVFAPFLKNSDFFGAPQQVWMVNFRVRDLASMTSQLTDAGIAVKLDPKEYPNGRFARIHDPEGNPIELWEPRDPASAAED